MLQFSDFYSRTGSVVLQVWFRSLQVWFRSLQVWFRSMDGRFVCIIETTNSTAAVATTVQGFAVAGTVSAVSETVSTWMDCRGRLKKPGAEQTASNNSGALVAQAERRTK